MLSLCAQHLSFIKYVASFLDTVTSFIIMEKVTEMSTTLLPFMLNILQTGCNHSLLFNGLLNCFPPRELKKKRNRRKTIAEENNKIAVSASVAHNSYVNTRQISRVCQILKHRKYYPFNVLMYLELHGNNRVIFCHCARRVHQFTIN